jgi:di/tricarboxylate transporter
VPGSAVLTLLVLGVAILLIVREVAPPDAMLFAALVVLMAAGVVTPERALASFGNPAVATIGALFIVAAGMRATGVLESASRTILGRGSGLTRALLRLTSSTAVLSAFIANTPIVAMGVPTVTSWAERNRVSPSRLLIPLSYASILGGICTLIGTSTNLVSHGLLLQAGMPGFTFFELAAIGVPCAVLGTLYLVRAAPRLLTDRVPIRTIGDDVRRYLVEMRLSDPSPLVGKTILEAGLRHLPGLFLVRVERSGGTISPVGPEVRLLSGDLLTFAGVVETIVDLRKYVGLTPTASERPSNSSGWELHEAVVSPGSPLVGSNIRDASFRGRYNAAVIAVHRRGERIEGRIGDIVLRPGDTLLLEAAGAFSRAFRDSSDFYLVSRVGDSASPRRDRAFMAVLILAAMVALVALEILPIVVGALGAGMAMVVFRCISLGEAKRSIDWSVLLTIGSALGIATALEASGAAAVLAEGVAGAGAMFGPIGVLAAAIVAAMALNALVSNTAAAAILFPVVVSAASGLGLDPRPFVVGVTVAASLSFATPIAYQTNLIVYGPGGYRFTDFTKIGVPLQILLAIVCLLLIPIVWPLTG